MLDQNEIYAELQKKWVELIELKVGDEVTIIGNAIDNQFGYGGTQAYSPKPIGKCIVTAIRNLHISVSNLSFPFFCLEKVENPSIKITVELNGKEVSPKAISKETWVNIHNCADSMAL